jgi:hypothetical protein
MNFAFKKTTCRVLVASVLALSFQTSQAGLIGADQALAGSAAPERALVLGTLDRPEVVSQLHAMGVDPLAARERVRTMSDQEVQALAHDLQAAPAAGDISGWGWVAIILIAALIWYYAIRK